ncbi:hypothetical protein RND59_11070 [Vibrio ruber]|uniref:Uncharacterized protein n=1 Tax=Vibrio ruber (strain DSM 16370 / JCM 11486 / BCRC 17186 / CECT 7878 / LMG 23124 / VR1) TaxID=1123498 RepID=A0A1R4LDV9_VIBR1|nr:hypothetical protein [Vibrio ruber]WNJ94675.1 hypothetical protein RND59_11070 [Vibrio ruber]SJN54761.1 hypothetical protein VR7878_00917 [Vibrio ruber DSM 16370]
MKMADIFFRVSAMQAGLLNTWSCVVSMYGNKHAVMFQRVLSTLQNVSFRGSEIE